MVRQEAPVRWAIAGAALALAGCLRNNSSGDDDGGSLGPTTGGELGVTVLEEATFLSLSGADVRTNHLLRLQLTDGEGLPVIGLGPERFTFQKDGIPSTSENFKVPTGDLAKVDVALCLDNSRSLAVSPVGEPTPEQVEELKEGAKAFVQGIVDSADSLRIYRFSTSSRTELVGRYVVEDGAWVSTEAPEGEAPSTAEADIDAAIEPGPLDTGTALFQAVQLALDDDPQLDDLTVVFSDGVEEGSSPGSREAVLEDVAQGAVVYAIGVGDGVSEAELDTLTANGGTFLVDTFEGVQQTFGEVAAVVQSIYTVLFDAPDLEGTHDLVLTIRDGDGRSAFVSTTFEAGLDAVLSSYFLPLTPGTKADYRVCESAGGACENGALEVLGETFVSEEGVLHFRVVGLGGDGFVAPFGDGAVNDSGAEREVLLPPRVEGDTVWQPSPASSQRKRIDAVEDVAVEGVTYSGCIRVRSESLDDGNLLAVEWYARGVGLVRMQDLVQGKTVELLAPPTVVDDFSTF